MSQKKSFHPRKRLHKVVPALQKRLHKMKQVAGDLRRRLVGLQTENMELTDFFDAEIRWPLFKASLPLWQRHGRLSMPPIIVLVNLPEQILCYIRLAPHEDFWPYLHCRDCLCGAKSGYVRCLCMECIFFHGVKAWSPYTESPPASLLGRAAERLTRIAYLPRAEIPEWWE